MFRIFSAPVASFQSALGFKSLFIMLLPLLLLTACDDQPDLAPAPANDKPKIQIDIGDAPDPVGETHAAEPFKPIIMGYGGEWPLADCQSLLDLAINPETRICGVIGQGARPELDVILSQNRPTHKAGLFTVAVNSPDAPVVLFLSEYNSTLWQIESTPGTEVSGIAINGYEPQAVMGLKPETPTLITYNEFGNKPCNLTRARNSRTMADSLQKMLGRKPDFVAEIENGRAVCGWPVPPEVDLLSYGEFRYEKFDAFSGLMDELNRAVESGLIRPAGYDDLNAFKEARSMDGRLFIEDNGWEFLSDAYVVQNAGFAFPEIYRPGGREPERVFTFFIPPDLRLPEGPLKGARVLFMADGSCLGSKCGHGKGVYPASGQTRLSARKMNLGPECRFEGLQLPEGTKIYAGGAYEGRPTGREAPDPPKGGGAIDFSGFSYNPANRVPDIKHKKYWGSMNVSVNSPENPVVLILSAYNATEWNLNLSPGTKVAAVVLSGYHQQVLVNPPAGVPLLSGGHDEGRCWSFYFNRNNFARINQISENLFGRVPDRGFLALNGRLTIDPSQSPRQEYSADSNQSREVDNAALTQAVRQGLIRPASRKIKNAWYRKHMEKSGVTNLMDPADFTYNPPYPAYEILSEKFAFNQEMAEAGWVDFYLPENMNSPRGVSPGSFTIHFLVNGLCRGGRPGCGRD